ncbi:MAG: hypothetical protein C0406_00080 [Sideroxydans sp.]|nr:hypothetical protein [Sideroxydans sp.]
METDEVDAVIILLLLVNEADCLAYQDWETETLFQSLQENTAICSECQLPRSGLVLSRQEEVGIRIFRWV